VFRHVAEPARVGAPRNSESEHYVLADERAAAGELLQRVVSKAGPDVIRDRARTVGLLRDAARDRHRPLIDMLVRALDYGVPASLAGAAQDGRPLAVIERAAVTRLAEETMSDREAAAWAVGAWRTALGLGAQT
jgi:hypothetical protein